MNEDQLLNKMMFLLLIEDKMKNQIEMEDISEELQVDVVYLILVLQLYFSS